MDQSKTETNNLKLEVCLEDFKEHGWIAQIKGMRGMVAEGKTKADAFNELMTSLKVMLAYNAGINSADLSRNSNTLSKIPTKTPYKIDKAFYDHTGFYTHEELAAYEKGREHEESVILRWIEMWDGSTNSVLGNLLARKLKGSL